MKIYYTDIKNLKDNRWDPNYWRNDLILAIEELKNFKFHLSRLEEISEVTIGQSGKRTFIEDGTVQYIVVGNLLPSGVDWNKKQRFIGENSFNDPKRSRLENDDILVVISGGGSIGRVTLVHNSNEILNISQDIARVKFHDFPVYSTLFFLQSKWGQAQIYRYENGTGVTHLNQKEVKSLLIPHLPIDINEWCLNKTLEINNLHLNYINTREGLDKLQKIHSKYIKEFENKIIRLGKR